MCIYMCVHGTIFTEGLNFRIIIHVLYVLAFFDVVKSMKQYFLLYSVVLWRPCMPIHCSMS